MREKRWFGLLAIVLGLIILYLLVILGPLIEESIIYNQIQRVYLYSALEVVGLIIIGGLIEYKRILSLIKDGININISLLVVAVVLVLILIVPINLAMNDQKSLLGIFSLMVNRLRTRSILGVFAGIIMVRSLDDKQRG